MTNGTPDDWKALWFEAKVLRFQSIHTHVIYIQVLYHSYPLLSISNLHWYLYVQYYVYWSSELRILIPRLSMFAYFTSNYCSVLHSLRMQLNVDIDMSDKVGSCRWLAISCIILYHLVSSYISSHIILYHLVSIDIQYQLIRHCQPVDA